LYYNKYLKNVTTINAIVKTHIGLGDVYLKQGELKGAQINYNKALKLEKKRNNKKGIAGVGWDISIVPVKAGFRIKEPDGIIRDRFEADDLIRAIDWVVAGSRARVINMSLGATPGNFGPINGMQAAMEAANDAGAL